MIHVLPDTLIKVGEREKQAIEALLARRKNKGARNE
jgi:hypothetical protein